MVKYHEKELQATLDLLNEKEKAVYEGQKEKFVTFSSEITTFESILNELEKRSVKTENLLKEKLFKRGREEIYLGMQEADCESYQMELVRKKNYRKDLENRIGAIERTYPKEFEYLYQDLVLKKELMEVINERKEIKRKLKYKSNDLNNLKTKILFKEEIIETKKSELISRIFIIDQSKLI